MQNISMIEDKASIFVSAVDGKDEFGARKALSELSSEISSLSQINWEREKLSVLELSIVGLTESKLNNLRKASLKSVTRVETEEDTAREILKRVFCMRSGKGFSYMLLEGKNLRPFPSQEMIPLVRLICGEDKLSESLEFQKIHTNHEIEWMRTNIAPSGQTHYVMVQMDNQKYESICHVSIEEMLRNQIRRIGKYEIDPKFEKMVRSKYDYIFDIYEYALALKFCTEKANVIWLREHSNTGKTFFLGATEAKDYIFTADNELKSGDFVGDGPDKWGKMLFFFIDEATKFSADMKSGNLSYRMLYAGMVEVKMPLRILSSDNEIADLTNGVDKQIDNRVINMHHLGTMDLNKWLKDNGMNATSAQIMWQKIILTHILSILESWGKAERLEDIASVTASKFQDKYKKASMQDIGDYIKSVVETAVNETLDDDGKPTRTVLKSQRDLKDFLVATKEGILVRSPKTFFKMVILEYCPEKEKSFFKRYVNNDAIANMYGQKNKSHKVESGYIKGFLVTCSRPQQVTFK